MTTPLVSVIIPTHGRPQYLPRAVQSALACQGDSVEVIIVPNGADESWKQAVTAWQFDSRVRIAPVSRAHANVARNHGLSLANGRYIRFLDDDDYLLHDAESQVIMLEKTGADVCSGLIAGIDEDGVELGINTFIEDQDFICAAAKISGLTLVHGNLWRLSSIKSYSWDVSVDRAQDYVWMIDLAKGQEWTWIHYAKPVGIWFQHRMPRTSNVRALKNRGEAIINRLMSLQVQLELEHRLTMPRREAIAEGLWHYIQRGFPSHPFYWSKIGVAARAIDPHSHLLGTIYQKEPFRRIHPLLLQWLFLPARWATRSTRNIMATWKDPDYRRQL